MRHFENPISSCAVPMDFTDFSELHKKLQDRLLSRLLARQNKKKRVAIWQACRDSRETLHQHLESAREEFHALYRRFSLGVRTVLELRDAVIPQGTGGPQQRTWLTVLVGILEGDWSQDLADAVSTLKCVIHPSCHCQANVSFSGAYQAIPSPPSAAAYTSYTTAYRRLSKMIPPSSNCAGYPASSS